MLARLAALLRNLDEAHRLAALAVADARRLHPGDPVVDRFLRRLGAR